MICLQRRYECLTLLVEKNKSLPSSLENKIKFPFIGLERDNETFSLNESQNLVSFEAKLSKIKGDTDLIANIDLSYSIKIEEEQIKTISQ